MHDVEFPPPPLLETVMKRRGRLHVFQSLKPAKTALLVIDMQCAFVAEGAPMEVPKARGIVPNINRLAAAVREGGGRVVWVVTTLASDGPNAWPLYYAHFFRPERRQPHLDALTDGSELHHLYHALDVAEGESVISKSRFSAFIQGASGLEDHLRGHGIDTLLIVGTLTNTCCESTARDGMMRNFKVIMISDANASVSDEDHVVGLWTVFQSFGDVRTTDQVCALLRGEATDES